MTYAVLMGDMVSSGNLPFSHAHAAFNEAIDQANRAADPPLVSPLTITLGDEFQGLSRRLATTACLARDIRFTLMRAGIDCRFVIAQADIETPINRDRAWNMMGPGLGRAREILNRKRDVSLYMFSLPAHPLLERNLVAMGAAMTMIERRWTARQRDDVIETIGGASVDEIAHQRNVAVHSVYKVRNAANVDPYLLLWSSVIETLEQIDVGKI